MIKSCVSFEVFICAIGNFLSEQQNYQNFPSISKSYEILDVVEIRVGAQLSYKAFLFELFRFPEVNWVEGIRAIDENASSASNERQHCLVYSNRGILVEQNPAFQSRHASACL